MENTTTKSTAATEGKLEIDFGKNIIMHNYHGRKVGQTRNEVAIIPEMLIGEKYHISRDQAEANAKKIVKCWNNECKIDMHDELVNGLRELLNEFIYSLSNQCKVLVMTDEQTIETINKNSLVVKYRELLKQASTL